MSPRGVRETTGNVGAYRRPRDGLGHDLVTSDDKQAVKRQSRSLNSRSLAWFFPLIYAAIMRTRGVIGYGLILLGFFGFLIALDTRPAIALAVSTVLLAVGLLVLAGPRRR